MFLIPILPLFTLLFAWMLPDVRGDFLAPLEGIDIKDRFPDDVAGIVGAEMYGVPSSASLISVKVLDNLGKVSNYPSLVQAVRDVTAEHIKNKKIAKTDPNPWNFRGSVINMSLTFVANGVILLDSLIAANKAGISVYAAAGNYNDNEGDYYPCANVQTKCIAAVDATYNKYKRSNYGSTIDYIAPGKDILSLHCQDDLTIALMSGTSQASPHAAGAAAIFTSWGGLETNYDLSQNFVYQNSIGGVVSGFPSGTTTKLAVECAAVDANLWIALLINTGIHSPLKYPKEPFRWARDHPHKPQTIDASGSATVDVLTQSVPPDELMTSVFTEMSTSTLGPVEGLTTINLTDVGPTATTSVQSSPVLTYISSSEPTGTPVCASSGTPFAQPAAQTLVSTFCDEPVLDAQFVPYIAMGNGTDQYGRPKSLNAEGHFILDGTTNVIWFRTRFTREACTGSFNGTYLCAERFSTILNGCQTNTITAKLGGTLLDTCAEYDLTVVDSHTDPFTDDDSPVGDFTCEDTPAPMTDSYPNTCTYWMSERADQTAIFVKPADGVCDGKDVSHTDGLAPGQGY